MNRDEMKRLNEEELALGDARRQIFLRLRGLELASPNTNRGAHDISPDDQGTDLLESVAQITKVGELPFFPQHTRLGFLKNWLLRVLRVYTRKQIAFNRAVTIAMEGVAEYCLAQRDQVNRSLEQTATAQADVRRLREEVESKTAALDAEVRKVREEWVSGLAAVRREPEEVESKTAVLDAEVRKVREEWVSGLAAVRRELERLDKCVRDMVDGEVALLQREVQRLTRYLSSARTETVVQSPVADFSSWPGMYFAFQRECRGTEERVRQHQAHYVSLISNCFNEIGQAPVLDVGCGRGEFLDLLQKQGIPARGVDTDDEMVNFSRARSLQVEKGDGIALLESERDNFWGAVVAFHVAEHLPPNRLLQFLHLLGRKVKKGGITILETVNPHSLYSLQNFYLDLTHWRPIPPGLLEFLLKQNGFERIETLFLSPVEDGRLAGSDPNIHRLNDLLFGAQDFAVFGYRI